MKFAIGQNAVCKRDTRAHTSYCIMKVLAILDDSTLILDYVGSGFGDAIHLDEDYLDSDPPTFRQQVLRYKEEDLFTVEEAQKEILRLEEKENKLSKEFESVRSQIQSKLDQAAELVKEAAALAKPFEKDLDDLKSEAKPLYLALDDNGWRSSHMRC